MPSLQTERVDVDSLVRERFQPYFGERAERPLSEQVIADSGLDSIGLVMVLTDLFLQVNLDPGDSRVKLRNLRTVEDVAALLRALVNGDPLPSSCCSSKTC